MIHNSLSQDGTKEKQRARLPYIDVQKGVLILLVVFHHVDNYLRQLNIEIDDISILFKLNIFFIGFFMQAFFFFTGYVSSFNKSFVVFLKSNVRTLLFPILFFWLINSSTETYFSHIKTSMFFITIDGQNILLLFESMWFLQALFVAKVIMWIVVNYTKKYSTQVVIMMSILIIGSIVNDTIGHYNNWLHYRNAFCMFFLLYFGHFLRTSPLLLKRLEKVKVIILISYLLVVLFLLYTNRWISYTHLPSFSTKLLVAYVFISTTGTLAFFLLLKNLRSSFFEYLGKNSLIIYGTHFVFLQLLEILFLEFFNLNGVLNESLYFVSVYMAAVLLCILSCFILNKRPMCFLIGKF